MTRDVDMWLGSYMPNTPNTPNAELPAGTKVTLTIEGERVRGTVAYFAHGTYTVDTKLGSITVPAEMVN